MLHTLNKLLILIFTLFLSLQASADRALLLESGQEALQVRVDLIQQAENEILVEYFSVWDDDTANGFFSLLLAAAQRGVKVKVIIDALINRMPRATFATLLEHGIGPNGNKNIEIKLYNPVGLNISKITHRNHSKMIIVDGKYLITGGRNINDKYYDLSDPGERKFNDLDVLIDGPAVLNARDDFYQVFRSDLAKDAVKFYYMTSYLEDINCNYKAYRERKRCNRRRSAYLRKHEQAKESLDRSFLDITSGKSILNVRANTNKQWLEGIPNRMEVEFISHKPDELVNEKTAEHTWKLIEKMEQVEEELIIVSPYLIPLDEFIETFQYLIQKGVYITLVTNSPAATDNLFAQSSYQTLKGELISMGIEIYEFIGPGTAHGKAMIFDGQISYVGTFNLDPRSSYLNREVGLFINNDGINYKFSSALRQYILEMKASSILVGKDGSPRNLEAQERLYKSLSGKKRFGYGIAKFLAPLLKNQL